MEMLQITTMFMGVNMVDSWRDHPSSHLLHSESSCANHPSSSGGVDRLDKLAIVHDVQSLLKEEEANLPAKMGRTSEGEGSR